MSSFVRIRNSVHYRHLFDALSPVFWPVLYWSLWRTAGWLKSENRVECKFILLWWGGIKVVFIGDRQDKPAPNPFAPLKPRWDDPVWSSDLPACLEVVCHRARNAFERASKAGVSMVCQQIAGPCAPALDTT